MKVVIAVGVLLLVVAHPNTSSPVKTEGQVLPPAKGSLFITFDLGPTEGLNIHPLWKLGICVLACGYYHIAGRGKREVTSMYEHQSYQECDLLSFAFIEFDKNGDDLLEYDELFPQGNRTELIDSFHEMDVNANGRLEPDEFTACLRPDQPSIQARARRVRRCSK